MNSKFLSTRKVAALLKVRPDALSRMIWVGKIDPPEKSPSGDYLWSEKDLERACWKIHHRSIKNLFQAEKRAF